MVPESGFQELEGLVGSDLWERLAMPADSSEVEEVEGAVLCFFFCLLWASAVACRTLHLLVSWEVLLWKTQNVAGEVLVATDMLKQ